MAALIFPLVKSSSQMPDIVLPFCALSHIRLFLHSWAILVGAGTAHRAQSQPKYPRTGVKVWGEAVGFPQSDPVMGIPPSPHSTHFSLLLVFYFCHTNILEFLGVFHHTSYTLWPMVVCVSPTSVPFERMTANLGYL